MRYHAVTHLALGSTEAPSTGCSLIGIQHRPLNYTRNPSKVTCMNCRRWMAREDAYRAQHPSTPTVKL